MKKTNNRGKSSKELQDIRIQAVKLIKKGYANIDNVSKTLGVSKSSIYERLRIHKKQGYRGLKAKSGKKVGRPRKEKNKLTKKEKEILINVISQEPRKTEKLMLDFGLWTIKYIQYAIKILFKKDMKRWRVRDILIELGFTHQKPLFRAYQQNPEKVEKWLNEELPYILDEADKENRKIYYGDEAGFRSTNHKGKTWAKKGKTPIVKTTGARFGVNAISAISPRGDLNFMVYEKSFTSDTLIQFFKRMIYKSEKNITLILDGHPTHKTKKVNAYLESINYQIKLYYLPGYSPELNPDEQVRNQIHNDLKGQIIVSKKEMIDKVRKGLYSLQKDKNKIKSYYKHPDIQWNYDQLSI